MPQIKDGQGLDVSVPQGQSIAIATVTGTYSATVISGTSAGTVLATASDAGGTFGPYASGATVRLSAGLNSCVSYEVGVAPVVGDAPAAKYSLDPTTGAVVGLVGPDGEEVNLLEPLEPTVIADWVSLAATGAVCGSPCLINRIRCATGSAVTLTVYDNAAASSGTVLYTGSLSAGQEASISTPIRAINGVRAVFASGSFEFQIQQEAA